MRSRGACDAGSELPSEVSSDVSFTVGNSMFSQDISSLTDCHVPSLIGIQS